jgi:hypothetical protein
MMGPTPQNERFFLILRAFLGAALVSRIEIVI